MRSREIPHRKRHPYHSSSGRRSRNRISLWMLLLLPFFCWVGYRELLSYFSHPQAMLVLGGGTDREKFAAHFAHQHPNLPIWVSSGSPRDYSSWVFSEAGVDLDRVNLDYRAVDTVTNFTTLVDDLQQRGITSVYLITSDYHMRRARLIGEIVLGSRGIHIRPIPVPSNQDVEPLAKALRDGARAILWVTTGHTGSTLSPRNR